ncbi:TPA: hypothetical protein ACSP93_004645, partial [Aeromonas hydrophila]
GALGRPSCQTLGELQVSFYVLGPFGRARYLNHHLGGFIRDSLNSAFQIAGLIGLGLDLPL